MIKIKTSTTVSANLLILFVIVLPVCYGLTLSLEKGWNLISLPVMLNSNEISTVLSSINGSYERVVYFSSTDKKYYIYSPDDIEHSNLFYLNNSMGFWILMNRNDTLILSESPVNTLTIYLEKGWNLIGVGDIENVSADELFAPINDSLEIALFYNQKWIAYRTDRMDINYSKLKEIEKGKGYWVKMKKESVLKIHKKSPEIDAIIITPDESADLGVQINPNADNYKEVFVDAIVTNRNGIDKIENVKILTPKGEFTMALAGMIDSDSARYNSSFKMDCIDIAGIYNITVTVTDKHKRFDLESAEFDYLALAAINLDAVLINFSSTDMGASSCVYGDLNFSTVNIPTVKNAGNVYINAILNATDLLSEMDKIAVDNVRYRFGRDEYHAFSNEFYIYPMELAPNQLINADFNLTVPLGTLPRDYYGTISVNGVTSR